MWLALHFPFLAMDIFMRGTSVAVPLAVASSSAVGATLVSCNALAHSRGVRNGMSVAAAWALASDL
ncbi:MAG TPA: hypothetical protein VFY80_05420, partial [Burkholderiales bacterium]|nr:hypothetical protein [Burkholderiales bacterium]